MDSGLTVGDKGPTFEIPDEHGNPWDLSHHLAHGPVVLVLYRGDW